MIKEMVCAAVGTIAFSLLYAVPKKHYLDCGMIGAAGWLMYRLMLSLHLSISFSVFFAAVFIVMLSRVVAVRRQCPATVFLITGIFPLVPGGQFYWACYYLVTNQLRDAMASGFAAMKIMLAIVLGIIFVFEIPQVFFHRLLHRK